MERKPNRSMWDPLSEPLFRALWIAALVSNIGSWMHDVAAAWLMTSLSSSPVMISLMQTASYLPFFVLALPSGAFADIFNRRTVLLVGQFWMLAAAGAIGLCSLYGWMTPWLLLTLTLMLGVGGAITSPAWNAVLPELVSKKNLEGAIALGGMGWNIARGVGSAIGGFIVAMSGPSAVFLLNALSFLAVLWVFWSWKRPPSAESTNNERVVGAIRAGVRFVRHSPVLLAVLWRTIAFVSCSTCFWAILPLFCRVHLKLEAHEYGLVLTLFGIGAILGAGLLPKMRKTMSLDACTAVGTLLFASGMLGLAFSPHFYFALASSTVAGAAWIAVTSSLNMGAQLACPAWVRSRALAVYILVWHGTMAIASLAWGTFANFFHMENALLVAACGLMISFLLAPRRHKLGDLEHVDLSASGHWPDPVIAVTPHPEHGPVQVSIEYLIQPEKAKEFTDAMSQLAVQRRRDGAFQWHLMCDLEDPRKYLETYFVETWAEHERQHQRVTIADKAAEERVDSFHIGPNRPHVRHLISGIGFDGEIIAPERTEMLPGTEPGQPPCGVCEQSADEQSAETKPPAVVPASHTGPVTEPLSLDTSDQEVYADTSEQIAFSTGEDLNTPTIGLPVGPPASAPASETGSNSSRNSNADISTDNVTGNTTLMSASREGDNLADFLSDLSSHEVPPKMVPESESRNNNPEEEEAGKIDSSVDIEALFARDPGDTLTKIRPLRSLEWIDTFDGIERPIPRDGNVVDIDSLFSKQDRLHVVDDEDPNGAQNAEPASLVDDPGSQSLFDLFDSFEASAGGRNTPTPIQPPELLSAASEEQIDTFQDIQALKDQPSGDTLTSAGNNDNKTPETVPAKNVPSDTLVDMEVYFGQDPGDTLVDIEALSKRNPEDSLLLEADKIDTLVDIEALEAYCSQNPSDKLTRPKSDNSSLFRTPLFTGSDTALSVETGENPPINTGEMEALHIDTDEELAPIAESITGEMSAVSIEEPVSAPEEPVSAPEKPVSAPERDAISALKDAVSGPKNSATGPKDALSALRDAVSASKDRLKSSQNLIISTSPDVKDQPSHANAASDQNNTTAPPAIHTSGTSGTSGIPISKLIPPPSLTDAKSLSINTKRADSAPETTDTAGTGAPKGTDAPKDLTKSLPSKRLTADVSSRGRKLLPLDPGSSDTKSVPPEPKSVPPEPKSVTPEPKSATPEPKSAVTSPSTNATRSYDPKSGLPSRAKLGSAPKFEAKPESEESRLESADTKQDLKPVPSEDKHTTGVDESGVIPLSKSGNSPDEPSTITGELTAFEALSGDDLLQDEPLTDVTTSPEDS